MRISKTTAYQIAAKITEKKQAEVKDLEQQYVKFITDCYTASIPREVLEAKKKHPEWIYTTNDISYKANGVNWESVYTTTDNGVVPNSNGGNNAHLELNAANAKTARQLKSKWESAKSELKSLKKEIEVALSNLRTTGQIAKHLPEAIPFLPTSNTLAISINYGGLRKKIKQVAA